MAKTEGGFAKGMTDKAYDKEYGKVYRKAVSTSSRADGAAKQGKTKGKMLAGGGMSKDLAEHAGKPASKAHKGLKAGGFVRAADGVAKRGKTKGKVL